MNKAFFKISAGILLLIAYGCNNSSSEKSTTSIAAAPDFVIRNTHKIPLDSAKTEIANYAGFCKVNSWDTAIRSFRISSYDLNESLGSGQGGRVQAVRVYLGIKGIDVANDFHLFIVPLKVGTDLDSIPYARTDSAFVYDLTTPCPKTCDVTSELYSAFDAAKSNIQWKPANR